MFILLFCDANKNTNKRAGTVNRPVYTTDKISIVNKLMRFLDVGNIGTTAEVYSMKISRNLAGM
jgi:hypothetical protein